MNIEICAPGRYLVLLSREDLSNYNVNFNDMTLSEPSTKLMITDLIGKVQRLSAASSMPR